MNTTQKTLVLAISLLATSPLLLIAKEKKIDFEKDIWPICERSCLNCHKAPYMKRGKLKKPKGELRIDTVEHFKKGGENGEVIVPGKPEKSSFYTLASLDPDDDDIMPAKGDPLSKKELELIRLWILQGADFGDWKKHKDAPEVKKPTAKTQPPSGLYRHEFTDIKGKKVSFEKEYKDQVLLIVNVASRCGYTRQYSDLQKLYDQYKGSGLRIIGFPANDFGKQEPGSNSEILKFCQEKFSVTFDMMSKSSVKGNHINPIFKTLTTGNKNPALNGPVKWNFEKFLIGKDGELKARFRSKTKPFDKSLSKLINKELSAKNSQI